MKSSHRILIPTGLLGAVLALSFAADNAKKAKPEEIEKVKAALPTEAPAKPKKKHEVLVFSKTNGFRHSSIEIGIEAMKMLGEKTGAFNVTATEDENAFEPENLKKFDGIIFLNTTNEVFAPAKWPDDPDAKKAAQEKEERLKKSLVEFVSGGKGLIGIHAATDTYKNWKEFTDMMGGAFDGHPWHEKVGVKNLVPDHPINKAFDGKDWEITDEIYQFRPDTASKKDRKMLLALDPANTKTEKGKYGKDGFYPISWLRKYGEGRTFYCSLGHREEIYWNPTVLQHYLAGIQYALGDLEADATPTEGVAVVYDGEEFVAMLE